jgi:hypothetical protein
VVDCTRPSAVKLDVIMIPPGVFQLIVVDQVPTSDCAWAAAALAARASAAMSWTAVRGMSAAS